MIFYNELDESFSKHPLEHLSAFPSSQSLGPIKNAFESEANVYQQLELPSMALALTTRH